MPIIRLPQENPGRSLLDKMTEREYIEYLHNSVIAGFQERVSELEKQIESLHVVVGDLAERSREQ